MTMSPAGYSLALSAAIVILLLLLEGFFSGTEIALLSLHPIKAKNPKVLFFLKNTERLLATTLLGTNLCVIANSSYVTYILRKYWGIENEIYTVLILSPLVLIIGETIPKTIAKNRPEALINANIELFTMAYKILSPLSAPFTQLLKLMGQEGIKRELTIKREDLPHIIDTRQKTDIKEGEKRLIESILRLREIRAKEIMKPIIKVRTLEVHHTVKMAVETFNQTGYTRLPVYEEHIYNIKGIVNVFDLIEAPLEEEVGRYIKKALFVPETETAWSILKQMQNQKLPLAIVVDEYGAASGLITVEDTLEELVGEIADEYDLFSGVGEIVEIDGSCYIIPADIPVDEVCEKIKVELPKREAYETLSGLLMYMLDRVPKVGDKISIDGIELEVIEADEKKVKKVKLWKRS